MKHYDLNKWYAWSGGTNGISSTEPALDGDSKIEVVTPGNRLSVTVQAKHVYWRQPLLFRVISYPPEEEWVECYRGADYRSNKERGTCIIRDGVVDWNTWRPLV